MRKIDIERAKKIEEKAVVTALDEGGYPFSVTTDSQLGEEGTLVFRQPEGVARRLRGEASVLKSHITPLQSGGYTDRRYVLLQGKVRAEGGELTFAAEKSWSWDEKNVPFPQYAEVSVPQARRYMAQLASKVGRSFSPWLPLFSRVLRITRLPFLVASAIPVAVGAVAAARGGSFSPLLFVLTLVGIAFAHIGVNTANDYFDTSLGADWKNTKPTPFSGGSRSLQYNLISPRGLAGFSSLSFLAAAAIGVYIALVRGVLPIAGFMAAGFFFSIFYTMPPLKLAYRGLGEASVILGFGPVLVCGSYFIQTGTVSLPAVFLSVPVGIFVGLILYVNEIPDRVSDLESGKRNLVARMGRRGVLAGYWLLVIAAMAAVVAGVALRLLPLLSLVSLLVLLHSRRVYRAVSENFGDQYAMIQAMSDNVKQFVYIGVLLIASYLASIALGLP